MNNEIISVFQRALDKVKFMESELDGRFPHITQDGKWLTSADGHWTGGFWTGLLWFRVLYNQENNQIGKKALAQVKKLAVRMKDNKTHDMGFIFGPSCVFGNHIIHDGELVEMALSGAHNMEYLFEERTGLILAWDEPGYEGVAIVDTIMNVPLMVWTSKQEGNNSLFDKAIVVANHIQANHIREDGSTWHVVKWDTNTYQIKERTTHQGYSSDSCWSRGQAWALYGFANMFRYTSDSKYLKTSERLAEYFWSNLDSELLLPRWDFIFKNKPDEPLDASAASVASSGMLLLSSMMKKNNQSDKSQLWKLRAEKIVQSLMKHCFYKTMDKYGLIENVTVDKPRNSGINESSMYGDYYFMEALFRLMNFDDDKKLELLY